MTTIKLLLCNAIRLIRFKVVLSALATLIMHVKLYIQVKYSFLAIAGDSVHHSTQNNENTNQNQNRNNNKTMNQHENNNDTEENLYYMAK